MTSALIQCGEQAKHKVKGHLRQQLYWIAGDGERDVIGQQLEPGSLRMTTKPMLVALIGVLSLLVGALLLVVFDLHCRVHEVKTELYELKAKYSSLELKIGEVTAVKSDDDSQVYPQQASSDVTQVYPKEDGALIRVARNTKGKKKKKCQCNKKKAPSCPPCPPCPTNGTSMNIEELNKYCDTHNTGKQLESVEYLGYFYDFYSFSSFQADVCIMDQEHKCNVCREATIEYFRQYSPLHFYRYSRGNNSLVHLVNNTTFKTLTPGTYLLHMDIVMVDESKQQSIGVFINSELVSVCPKGGFLLPQKGYASILQYKMCSIDGMVVLRTNDVIQIKTMDKNTTVRLHRQSLLKLVLLQPDT